MFLFVLGDSVRLFCSVRFLNKRWGTPNGLRPLMSCFTKLRSGFINFRDKSSEPFKEKTAVDHDEPDTTPEKKTNMELNIFCLQFSCPQIFRKKMHHTHTLSTAYCGWLAQQNLNPILNWTYRSHTKPWPDCWKLRTHPNSINHRLDQIWLESPCCWQKISLTLKFNIDTSKREMFETH